MTSQASSSATTPKTKPHLVKKIKVFPPKVKSFQNIATYQKKLRGEVPSTPLPPPCNTVGLWICVYVRGLNGAKFYRQLDGDITDLTQQRVTVYIERMFNDGYIDEKTKSIYSTDKH